MKLSIQAGATSQSVLVFIQDSSSSTGAGLAGLAFNTSGLTCYYSFAGANAGSVSVTLATLAAVNSAWSSAGFKEVDGTNMKGVYRFDIPNAALATSKGRSVVVYFQGATNMAPLPIEIELTGWDNQDAVHGGMSALPNTACTTNASLLTSGTGTDQLSVTSGRVDLGKALGTAVTLDANNVLNVSAKYWAGTAITATSIPVATAAGAAGGLLIAGSNAATTFASGSHFIGTVDTVTTVTNQLTAAAIATGVWQDATAGDFTTAGSIGKSLFTSGNAPGAASGLLVAGSNAATTFASGSHFIGTVDTVTTVTNQLSAAAIATGVWQDATAGDFTTASSIGKSLYTSGNAPGAASGLALVGSNVGAATSVSGAVGSVTGNVGGNVVGSVGSVTGLTTATIATAVWQDLLAGGDFGTVGSIGKLLGDNINATITSRMATFSLPTNFAALLISAGGHISNVDTLATYTGNTPQTGDSYARIGAAGAGLTGVALAATGLDAISTTAPTGAAGTFREMIVQLWRRFFRKSTATATQIKTFADDGTTVVTTQTVADDGTTQTQGSA